jgi:hypothetical protein
MLRVPPHCLDIWFTDGSEVVSLIRRLHSTSQNISWYSYTYIYIYKECCSSQISFISYTQFATNMLHMLQTCWTKCKKRYLMLVLFLGCYFVWVMLQPFQRSMQRPSSGWHLDPEDRSSLHLQNIGNITHIHIVHQPKNRININKNHWEPKITIQKFLLPFNNPWRCFLVCNPGIPLYSHN